MGCCLATVFTSDILDSSGILAISFTIWEGFSHVLPIGTELSVVPVFGNVTEADDGPFVVFFRLLRFFVRLDEDPLEW